jgi:hypothetical protein
LAYKETGKCDLFSREKSTDAKKMNKMLKLPEIL